MRSETRLIGFEPPESRPDTHKRAHAPPKPPTLPLISSMQAPPCDRNLVIGGLVVGSITAFLTAMLVIIPPRLCCRNPTHVPIDTEQALEQETPEQQAAKKHNADRKSAIEQLTHLHQEVIPMMRVTEVENPETKKKVKAAIRRCEV